MIPIFNFDTNPVEKRRMEAWPDTCRMMILGPSGSGKTNVLLSYLGHRQPPFKHIYLCTRTLYQAKYQLLQESINDHNKEKKNLKNQIHFQAVDVDSIPEPEEVEEGAIIIFDHILTERQDRIANFFLRGRHRKISCVYISQSFTRLEKKNCIRSNMNYLILMPGIDGVNLRQIYVEFCAAKMTYEKFRSLVQKAWSFGPYDFFTIDLDNNTFKHNFDDPLTHDTEKDSDKKHYLQDTDKRRVCKECYRKLTANYGREIARKKSKNVSTVCVACPNIPFLCSTCFEEYHASDKI